jgi:hypothetical protein
MHSKIYVSRFAKTTTIECSDNQIKGHAKEGVRHILIRKKWNYFKNRIRTNNKITKAAGFGPLFFPLVWWLTSIDV